jgi:4-amino-4-deoxy-L-arabinose transferase-like glycosyltransferase
VKSTLLSRISGHRALLLLLSLYLILGFTYSLVNPLLEASDELWHYPFVKHLADGHGLPVQQPGVKQPWRQEGSQPPLYYAFSALVTSWIDTSDLDQLRWRNPHADIGIPTSDRNINMIIHTQREALPTGGAALAVYLVRWLSVLMGGVTVVATYLIALEVAPKNRPLALGASAFVALNPMFLFISASVNNDNLANMLSALALWQTIRLIKGHTDVKHLTMLGLTIGLAALSKASSLGMFGLVGLALLIVAYQRRSLAFLLRSGIVIYGLAGLVAGWWFYRNWRLYGDPLGLNTFVAIVGPRHPRPTLVQLWGERVGFTMSFWGFFGGLNVPMSPWLYRLLDIAAGIGLAGFLLAIVRRWPKLQTTFRWAWLLLVTWPVVVLISLVRWTLMTIATQGRLMFAALPAIAIVIVTGWLALAPRRHRPVAAGLVTVLFLALAIAAPTAYIAPAYAQPPILTEADLPKNLERVEANLGAKMELIGYAPLPGQVQPGEKAFITLYWKALAPMEQNYSVFVHLLTKNDLIIGQRDMYPGQGTYPTSLWEQGDIVADTYAVPVSPATLTPTTAQVEVGLYLLETGVRLPQLGSGGQVLGDNVRFGEIEVVRATEGDIPNPVFFNLETKIALVGYDLDRTAARPGETIDLTLYWRALKDIQTNYAVSAQILDQNQQKWAQKDAWPQDGSAPTATWQKGQLIEDHYALTLHPQAPAGAFDLQVTMYSAENGQRLKLLGEAGQVQDDRILLGKIRVVRP